MKLKICIIFTLHFTKSENFLLRTPPTLELFFKMAELIFCGDEKVA